MFDLAQISPFAVNKTFPRVLVVDFLRAFRIEASGTPTGLRMVMKYVHPTAEHQRNAMKKFEAGLKPRLKVVGK